MKKELLITSLLSILGIGLFLSSCDKQKDIEGEHRTHIAIQKESYGPWSIMDKDGNIVVNDAYPSDVAISDVYDGVYWVRYPDYKYVLYSVDSPNKPLCDTCLAATEFATGRAIVSMKGKPLQVINTKGKVVETLSENYIKVSAFNSDGVARYESEFLDITGTLDRDGDEIKEQLLCKILPNSLGDGAMILSNGEIVDYDGNKLGYIDVNEYKIEFKDEVRFSDGLLGLQKKNSKEFAFINKEGKEQFLLDGYTLCFKDGYAVIQEYYGSKVFDKQGNIVMETHNTYDRIAYLAEGKFLKEEDEMYSIIDAQGNEISKLDKMNHLYIYGVTLLGTDRFLIGHRIYDMQGKLINEIKYHRLSESPCPKELRYVNPISIASTFAYSVDNLDMHVDMENLISRLDKRARPYIGTRTTSLNIDSLLYGALYSEKYDFSGPIFYRQGQRLLLTGSPVTCYTQTFPLPSTVDDLEVASCIVSQFTDHFGFKENDEGWLVKEDHDKHVRKYVKVSPSILMKVICYMENLEQ